MTDVKKDETVLTVGTRKGLFLLHSKDRRSWRVRGPYFGGLQVNHAFLDRTDGRSLWAGVTSRHWGPTVQRSTSFGARWTRSSHQPKFPKGSDLAVTTIWHVERAADGAIYAGVEPAGLFRSDDEGRSWESVDGLNLTPGRDKWTPGGGGLCLHTILPDPRDARHMVVAISAVGILETRDAGVTWHARNGNIRADHLPEKVMGESDWGTCPHKIVRDPRSPGTLYMQNHFGLYQRREDDDRWTDIGRGLPSRFGFPMAIDGDARLFTVPLTGDFDRTTPGGAMAVWRRTGAKWQRLSKGLPQENAFSTVLREGLATDEDDGVYCGTTTGELYASRDSGASWRALSEHLPPILSVEVARARG